MISQTVRTFVTKKEMIYAKKMRHVKKIGEENNKKIKVLKFDAFFEK